MEIAIVGLGCILPAANTVENFYNNLLKQHCAISSVPKNRWDSEIYFADARPSVEDTCYSRIGAFIENFETVWRPLDWGLRIPPQVGMSIDIQHKYAIYSAREALVDSEYLYKCHDKLGVTGVVMGVMSGSGNMAYQTATRIYLKEILKLISETPSFSDLPDSRKNAILKSLDIQFSQRFPICTSSSHEGEFGNCTAGRIANLFDFKGPSFSTDAACGSSLVALRTACDLLLSGRCYAVVAGASEGQMDIHHYIKYAKLGALSSEGSFPFDERASGFVMGEGAAAFVLKLLSNARHDGDKIYGVIRGIGASSDGHGRSMTSPTVTGQVLALKDAWTQAGVSPKAGLYVEAHGTGTTLGDSIEIQSMTAFLREYGLDRKSVGIGSVKANIGHLRAAAGAAGLLKAVLMLHKKRHLTMPNFRKASTVLDMDNTPLYVPVTNDNADLTQVCVNSFGFGGTNWHAVITSPP